MKDRFNFENESFEQCEEKVENEYSVNIPMRYYYKGKFRKGWILSLIHIQMCIRDRIWEGRVWLNPPYSRPLIELFVRKLAEHGNGI